MSLLVGASLVFPAAVLAESGSDSNSGPSTTTSSSSDDTDDNSNDITETETETHDMTERIDKFKASFKVRLGLAEAANIKAKCVAAQGVVGKIHTRFGNSVTKRTQAYTELQKNLDKLVEKLKAKNVDTASLEQQITELKSKITTYSTNLAAYKQALSDLKEINCKTDPTGFQAALLAARSARNTLVTDVLAIRTYLVDTIKPTLKTIKTQLEGKENDDDTSSTNKTNDNTTGGGNN